MDIVDRLRSDWTIRFGAESKEDAVKRRNARALEAAAEITRLRKERDEWKDHFLLTSSEKNRAANGYIETIHELCDRAEKAERERDEARAAKSMKKAVSALKFYATAADSTISLDGGDRARAALAALAAAQEKTK